MVKAVLSVVLMLVVVSSTIAKYIPKTGKRVPQTLSRGAYPSGDEQINQMFQPFRNKPLMVLFHLEDCPHSQALKKVFSENNEIQKTLDEDFIVLNLMYETTDKHLSPDGQYVPRILFVDPSMTVRADINGRYANRMYAYETGDINLLISNMQKAKKLLKGEL
uniref:Anterior gradient 2 n=1 Tax=Cyprinodon variegatus TaxID=28743 RepID=A0A3Q2DRS8_CYPVA